MLDLGACLGLAKMTRHLVVAALLVALSEELAGNRARRQSRQSRQMVQGFSAVTMFPTEETTLSPRRRRPAVLLL